MRSVSGDIPDIKGASGIILDRAARQALSLTLAHACAGSRPSRRSAGRPPSRKNRNCSELRGPGGGPDKTSVRVIHVR